jgi:hypothetical protein
MNSPRKRKATTLDQERIDRLVVSQASDESAWDAAVRVKRSEPAAISLPGELAARAAFLASCIGKPVLTSGSSGLSRERVELEGIRFQGDEEKLAL